MTDRAILEVRPAPPLITALSGLHPHSPFCTREYLTARTQLGGTPVLLGRMKGGSLDSGSVGYLSRTRWFRTLDLPSFEANGDSVVWVELLRRARRRMVAIVHLHTYAARTHAIPDFPWPTQRRRRLEHIIDLQHPIRLSSQHNRSIKRAVAAGANIVRLRAPDAAASHQRLINASMSRRIERGEAVDHVAVEEARMMLVTGAGELVQVNVGGETVSSLLLLRSQTSAYYHSGGTSPAGMEIGASPFLISACARILAEEGRASFNIGDATDDNPGLLRFKRGFGGQELTLEAATVELLPFTGIERAH